MTQSTSHPIRRVAVTLHQDTAGVWYIQATDGKPFPASPFEVYLWLELVEVWAQLAALTEYAARLTAGELA